MFTTALQNLLDPKFVSVFFDIFICKICYHLQIEFSVFLSNLMPLVLFSCIKVLARIHSAVLTRGGDPGHCSLRPGLEYCQTFFIIITFHLRVDRRVSLGLKRWFRVWVLSTLAEELGFSSENIREDSQLPTKSVSSQLPVIPVPEDLSTLFWPLQLCTLKCTCMRACVYMHTHRHTQKSNKYFSLKCQVINLIACVFFFH